MSRDTQRDRAMILNPLHWPLEVLPLKRRNPFEPGNVAVFAPPLGVIKIAEDAEIEIVMGILYDNLSAQPRVKYENVDALLADGWVVD